MKKCKLNKISLFFLFKLFIGLFMIRFFIKCIIFLFLLFVIVSFFAPQEPKGTNIAQEDNINARQAIDAVQTTVSDLSNFCTRNTYACTISKEFFSTIGIRARDGAKIIYEYLDKTFNTEKNSEKN